MFCSDMVCINSTKKYLIFDLDGLKKEIAKGKEELDKMLKMGAIDLETYTKAMEKLKKDTTLMER